MESISSPHTIHIPARAQHPVASFVPPVTDPETLRALARTAIEAATQAGAHYADIRVGEQRHFFCTSDFSAQLTITYGYGLRVAVDGATAFIGGTDPAPERLVRAARAAVATARGLAKISRPNIGLDTSRLPAVAPMPEVTGEWHGPVEIDPFSVSPDDHLYAIAGFDKLGEMFRGPVSFGGVSVTWTAETRVFASSEGSMITQHLARVLPTVSLSGFSQDPSVSNRERMMPRMLSILPAATAGFECVLGTTVRERVIQAMHDMVPWTTYKTAPVEVGRKELVLDGAAFGALIGATVIPALALDRVLGEEQDVSGTSFLAPPVSVVGQPLFSPSLNVSVATGGTHYDRRQWDDEGIIPRTFPVIDRGAVVDYFASRATISATREWSAPHASSVQPQGVFRANVASEVPRPMPGACAVASVAAGPSSLFELAGAVKDGVIVRGGDVVPDQQGAGGVILNPLVFEVRAGKITRRLLNAQLEFSTKALLKNITAIGGPSTVEATTNWLYAGVPVTVLQQAVTAPAVHIQNGNVTSAALRLS